MPFLIKLAARNLWRNRRRTILTFSALALGISWLIIVDSLTQGLTNRSVENIVAFETGALQVHAEGYFDEKDSLPLDLALPVEPARKALLATEGVTGVAPRIVAAARLNVGWEVFPVVAVAIDPDLDREALDLMEHTVGETPKQGAYEALVGSDLARLLEIEQGDWITLLTRTRSGAIQAIDLQVVGLAHTPHPTINQNHVYLPNEIADAALGMEGNVTEFVVRLAPGISPEAAAARVQASLREAGVAAEAIPWQRAAADFLALMQTSSASDMLLVAVILIIALVGVTNTILLGTLERKREIGTMKAMGLREREILLLFLLEATGIALLATLLGSALGALANTYLVGVGLDLATYTGDIDIGFPVGGTVRGVWNGGIFLLAGAASIATCWIAGYLPARRAARIDPARTMRE